MATGLDQYVVDDSGSVCLRRCFSQPLIRLSVRIAISNEVGRSARSARWPAVFEFGPDEEK
jgi:hypothetical protein